VTDQTSPAPIEILRAGTHTDARGQRVTITADDLAAIAAAYDPALHEAPVVVGHPADDAPAYGWVRAVRAEGDRLLAELDQVEPQFADLVRRGRYKKISVALYGANAAGNPRPGHWYLRHVGFLGAQPPAVKGLRPVQFGGGTDGVVELAETPSLSLVARLLRGLREVLLQQYGADTADRALPAEAIEAIADAPPVAPASPAAAFAEPTAQREETEMHSAADALAERERALADREAVLAEREARLAEAERRRRADEDAAFLDALVREARLPVELRPLAAALLGQLDQTAVHEFAEAGQVTPHGALRALLQRLPQRVAFGELAAADVRAADPSDWRSIEAAADALIAARAAQGQTVTFREAVRLVAAGDVR
jgi:hypothetical protein